MFIQSGQQWSVHFIFCLDLLIKHLPCTGNSFHCSPAVVVTCAVALFEAYCDSGKKEETLTALQWHSQEQNIDNSLLRNVSTN